MRAGGIMSDADFPEVAWLINNGRAIPCVVVHRVPDDGPVFVVKKGEIEAGEVTPWDLHATKKGALRKIADRIRDKINALNEELARVTQALEEA